MEFTQQAKDQADAMVEGLISGEGALFRIDPFDSEAIQQFLVMLLVGARDQQMAEGLGLAFFVTRPESLAHDIGRSLNPALVMGQVEGSIYMGLGEAVMEESAFRRLPKSKSNALVHRFPSLLEYKSPTFLDMPKCTTYLIEDPDERGPYGAKEVGQGPLLPMPPAVVNAIHDAVGVRIDQVPVQPHMIKKALEAKEKGQEPRFGPKGFVNFPYIEPLVVKPPGEGGDGQADNPDVRGVKEGTGTMSETAEASKP